MLKHAKSPWFGIPARLAFVLFAFLTSAYCLLAYIPDTYFAFIQAPFQPWLVNLIRFHSYFYWLLLIGLAATLIAQYPSGRPRRLVIEYLLFLWGAGIFLSWDRPFAKVSVTSVSFLWSLVTLFPVFWLGIIDRVAEERESKAWRSLAFAPALVATTLVGMGIPIVYYLRGYLSLGRIPIAKADLVVWALAVSAQLLFATFAVCVVNLALWGVSFLPEPLRFRVPVWSLLSAGALAIFLQKVILASVPFNGAESWVYAVTVAVALTSAIGGIRWPRQPTQAFPDPRTNSAARTKLGIALALTLVTGAYTVPAFIGVFDWNSILQKSWAVTLWMAAVASGVSLWKVRPAPRYQALVLVALSVASFVLYEGVQREWLWPQFLKKQGGTLSDALGRHTYFNPSYLVVREAWAISETRPCDALCQYVRTQTSIPASVTVPPVNVELVREMVPAKGEKPNIFIFVIDSLRRDYISPYNAEVDFTPEIGRFAEDSVVMRNSYTRYAGTTLSEPAIWAGTMMLHKHYVLPFHPMNNLERMVEMDGYDAFVSVDTILRILLDNRQMHHLDEGLTNWSEQDVCSTVEQVAQKIDARADQTKPIFMYTQPQNLHVVSLARAAKVRPPQGPPGINPSAATELRRLDACFGRFTRYLKARGLYDNSIIVLTADHGEAYGEHGHKSHAFGLFPSTLRVPLIMHLPPPMQRAHYVDPDAVAFNIDVTPTLLYLLGHRPIVNDERFGRPLFTETRSEHDQYLRKSYLVAVCYGPVYGILGGDGQSLFVADAMENTYQFFDLVNDPEGTRNLITDQILTRDQQLVEAHVQQISDLYRYRYHPTSLTEWMLR